MRLSIAQKLVAAFVGLTLLVLAATLGLARWSFEQGLLGYVNALEKTRLERVQTELADEYLAAGRSWSNLSEQRFFALIHRSAPSEARGGPPRPGMPPPARGRLPQRMGGEGFPPTALYDLDGHLVVGLSSAPNGVPAIRVPVLVDNKVIGELRSEPREHITAPLETEFSRQQLQTSWLIGIASLVLAFGVSLLLARGLLAPVRRMINSVALLSRGNYSHRMNESRGDELGQLTKDLDRLGATLEANQSSRKRLLADISHELRTPLTVLVGEIEALKDGVREFNAKELGSLDQEVQRLSRLIDDLYQLSISDVGGLRYQFATVDIIDCLQQAVEGMRERAAAQGIELCLARADESANSVDLAVTADFQRIDQLLQNILENSLAYTDTPGRVVVSLSGTDTMAVITIADTPPGVDVTDCEKLFDPLFRQEASRSRRTGGAGLGLAICRSIVVAHGGSIAASPSAEGGLSIRIELPLAGERKT